MSFDDRKSFETNLSIQSSPSYQGESGEPSVETPVNNEEPVPEKNTTGGQRSTAKQLEPGTLLNGRYEIVRRIGGGGMGAVYLAKDRNLGDAPRAVKEMVESHLDPAQHEKAIGDFKRESLLLTSLEHPSIPTIYDYFLRREAGSLLPGDEIHFGWRPGVAAAQRARRTNRREDRRPTGECR